jgi:predicted small lipoprotein YifL
VLTVRLLLALIAALSLVACGLPAPEDPGPVVIPDDDDSSTADDDDTTADDDDDDDDDATGSADLRAWTILIETETLGAGSISLGFESAAVASFATGEPLPFGDPAVWDGLPLPGAGLHPEQMPAEEGCVLLSSTEALDPLPASDAVGGVVNLAPTSAGATLELADAGGIYSWDEAAALGASTYSVGVKGGADWPPASLDGVLDLPAPATGFLQGPGGTISNLSVIEFRWDQMDDPGGVEVLMFRWLTVNQTAWAAVRCMSMDDGSVFIDASGLAAGNGDITVTVSRATWLTDGIQASGRDVHAHLGAIRAIEYGLTPSGR